MPETTTPDEDQLVSVLPIHYSNALASEIQIHQFPLLTRPLQVPPSAALSGKKIRARIKPQTGRLEIHVPADTRHEVWNKDRSKELGNARADDDVEKGQGDKGKQKETDDYRLSEVRLQSERIPDRGAYMLGIVRQGHLHLHPISQTHQLRPTMTYMDVLMRKNTRRNRVNDESDVESDDGPPPDPDEVPQQAPAKKEKKSTGEAKEVQVAVKKVDDKGGQQLQGGLSGIRREMLSQLREEEEENWDDLEYYDGDTEEAANAFEAVFSNSEEQLECQTPLLDVFKSMQTT